MLENQIRTSELAIWVDALRCTNENNTKYNQTISNTWSRVMSFKI